MQIIFIMLCKECGKELSGKQTKYCSIACKSNDSEHHKKGYYRAKLKAVERKLELVKKKGDKCAHCGYDKNLAALCFHHKNPKEKSFLLDARAIGNRSQASIEEEAKKCILLCHNCHAEEHNPNMLISLLKKGTIKVSKRITKPSKTCINCGEKIYENLG